MAPGTVCSHSGMDAKQWNLGQCNNEYSVELYSKKNEGSATTPELDRYDAILNLR